MTQLSNNTKTKHEHLFIEFSYFTRNYGTNALLYSLKTLNESTGSLESQSSQEENLTHELGVSFSEYGINFISLFFQTNRTKMLNFECNDNSALNDKVFEIICGVFKTTKDSILDKFDRDGIRVYASGSLFKLLLDTCGYNVKEIMKLTGKPRSIISRHKNIISNLDHKHIYDKKILIKFIEAKKQLIKYILDEYNQEN
jgi:hypothetical protein